MKRMQHPKHGFHYAQTPQEETRLRQAGWVEDDGSALARKLAPIAEPKRRGRPPKVNA